MTRLANLLTPAGAFGAGVIMVAIVALVFVAANGLGFRFDPFDQAEGRADRAEAVATQAMSDAAARSTEVAGARQVTAAVERATVRIRAADAIVQHHQLQAEEAPDATELLDPDRRDRLRDADYCLCRLSPRLCAGDPAPSRDAGDGDPALCPAASG